MISWFHLVCLPRVLRLICLVAVPAALSSCAIQHTGKSEQQRELQLAEQLRVEADLRFQEHDYQRASILYQSVLDILEQNLGPNHLSVALAANALADVHRANGQFPDAEALYQRALDILDSSTPEHPRHLATVLNGLGLLYTDTGNYARAEASLLRALTLHHGSLEPDHASVAITLNNLALLYKTLGRYPEALDYYMQARRTLEGMTPQSSRSLAVTLGNLASLQLDSGRYPEAKVLFRQALDLQERTFGVTHPGLAIPLNNLASFYQHLGEYDQAETLYRRALSLYEKDTATQTSLKATGLLSNIASMHASFGDYAIAEAMLQHVIAIQRNHLTPQHPAIADSLSKLAWVYQMRGQYTDAKSYNQQALEIRLKTFGSQHIKVARSFRSLGDLYLITGEFGRAELLYQQARDLGTALFGKAHPDVAITLNDLALLYRILGDYDRSEKLYTQALQTFEVVLGYNHPHIALTLHNMALLFYYQQNYARAEPLVRRALVIQQQSFSPDHPDIALNQVALARIFLEKHAYDEAQSLLETAVASQRKAHGEHHARVAFTLSNLAKTHKLRGDEFKSTAEANHEYALAKPLYYRALTIATSGGQPEVLWRTQLGLSQLFHAQNNPSAAIFYGYEAVTTLQDLREAVSALGKDLQQSFLLERYQVYRHLADLLISQGYIPEAQQVLGMLKETEYFDFVRRSADEAGVKTGIDLKDVAAFSTYFKFRDDLVSKGRDKDELDQTFELDPGDKKRVEELRQILADAENDFLEYLSTFERMLEGLSPKQSQLSLSEDEAIPLIGRVRRLGPGWVLIHTLVTQDQLHLILTTGDTQLVRFSNVKAVELHKTISQFHNALKTGSDLTEILQLAKQLYDWVIAPLANDLEQADAQTLALSLDGPLRYVPVAALYDGTQYLVDNYNVVMYTEAAKLHFESRPSMNWHIAGLGASEAPTDTNLGNLPAVKDELNGIVREENKESDEGVLPGVVFFDQEFTEERLKRLLEIERYSVLHVAGHFSISPGNMRSCKLFLGDGNELSLEEIKQGQKFRYNFLKELVTLSACNTAVGGSVYGNGIEVESFAALAQKKGAESVLATLWSVSDDSTGLLMQLFYDFRERYRLTKAEALRKAQLALLRGDWKEADGVVEGVLSTGETMITERYSHPFYWAPFVLMGNAL
jgi:CHAT domain-containing protein/Tfp pilus assembly protein PilF